jgi:hypothetical protein
MTWPSSVSATSVTRRRAAGVARGFGGKYPASVVDLAAAGGVESGAVENERRARGFDDRADFGVEVVEEGILVVEAAGHEKSVISIGGLRRVIKLGSCDSRR